jgi:Ser/Thr protein kinase RdoA (MazF antagonist)
MNNVHEFQKRINFSGDIKPLLEEICANYKIGDFLDYKVIEVGYEDYNLIIVTGKGKYFAKIFASIRSDKDCERYIEILNRAIDAGVKIPKLYNSSQGHLYKTEIDSIPIRLTLMEYIDGKSLYDLKYKADLKDIPFFAEQAALINKIDFKPTFLYDSWAIVNLLKEYQKTEKYLGDDLKLLNLFVKKFAELKIDELPHCLVHGDIIDTNVLGDKNGDYYIIDFAVANHYPRIQELAILLCNIFFDEEKPERFPEFYQTLIFEYQKYIPLTKEELFALPIYVQAAHAMHIIGATREREENINNSEENNYWMELGRKGLKYTTELWDKK